MIIIDILNPEEVAENHSGKFKITVAKVMGVNFKKRIETSIARQLKKEMEKNGLQLDVRVE